VSRAEPRERDFTLATYGRLCRALSETGYAGLGLADFLSLTPAQLPERFVLLRHDVESSPARARAMGEIEHRNGLRATYFFRTKRGVFDPAAIGALQRLGHEIGYHYEVLVQARGHTQRALELFGRELARLREHASVRVASMHGSPLFPWDNRDIWRHAKPQDFGLLGEVYRDIDYSRVSYFSDTGRTWHPRRYNIRDHAPAPPGALVDTTDDLIALVRSGRLLRLCLLAHPDRWSETVLEWRLRAVRDYAENRLKLAAWLAYTWARRTRGR
jgi:hypothetical protein